MDFCIQKYLAALVVGGFSSELAKPEMRNIGENKMPRNKAVDQEELLVHPIILRVNDATQKKLEKLLNESNCKSIGEVVRKILMKERINCFYRDATINGPMEELALVRKELKSIGVNINQQTRYFNACKSLSEKNFHAERTVELYKKVDAKMERLFGIISKLAQRWLPDS